MLLLCEGKEERQVPWELHRALAQGSATRVAGGMWQGWELGIPRWALWAGVGGQLHPCAAVSAHKPTEEHHLRAPTGFLLVGSVPELGRKIRVWPTSTKKLPETALKHRKGVLHFIWSAIFPSLCTSGDIWMQDSAKSGLLPGGECTQKAITPSQSGRNVAYDMNTGGFGHFLNFTSL